MLSINFILFYIILILYDMKILIHKKKIQFNILITQHIINILKNMNRYNMFLKLCL